MKTLPIEIKKIKRSWCIVSGASVLGKFRTEDQAKADLANDPDFYAYWAGSMSVSVENTPPVIVHI